MGNAARIGLWIAITGAFVLGAGLLRSRAQGAQERGHGPVTVDPISRVSAVSPFAAGCAGQQTGIDYLNSAVEPSVAVDPTNPNHLIGVWQQDRWSNGAATGVLTAVSLDRGRTWTPTFAQFSQCTGGTFERASDPWVTFSPNGIAYQSALVVNISTGATGVQVSRSSDGGVTWSVPITVHANGGDDKETITADPTDSDYVYTVWDGSTASNTSPAWFSRTTDGGATWEPAKVVYNPGLNGFSTGHQIVVLPKGTLIDAFVLTQGSSQTSSIAVIQSTDHGFSWSMPIVVAADLAIGVVDSRTQAEIRTGSGIPSAAVDPTSGAIYITWEDSRFSGGQREGLALSKSVDGGFTWSAPVQVNQVPNVQAFTPAIAVGDWMSLTPRTAVAITYYDFRQATSDVSQLLTNCWQNVSLDGGNTWRETPVAGPFDMLRAPLSYAVYFLGDYQALAASGNIFIPFFVTTNSAGSPIPSSVFALPVGRVGDTSSTGRVEMNMRPHPFSKRLEPKAGRKHS